MAPRIGGAIGRCVDRLRLSEVSVGLSQRGMVCKGD